MAAYIRWWQPVSVPPQTAAFAREVVTQAGPGGRERAKNLLWAAGRLADWAIGLGLEPVPEVLLHSSVIERFAAHAPGLTGVTRRTLRTSLRFLARAVVPALAPADTPLPRERAKAPYSPAEIDGCLALASAQPTAARRMRAAGLVCLGAGAGLIRKRFSTRNSGEITGYAVALTGDTAREGGPVWFGGGKLAADLTLPKLRCRWDPARTRAAERFTTAERNAIWEHAARTADAAARNLRSTGPDDPAAADAAWAAADTLHAAAAALGSPVLRQAADSFDRAARAPYGRVPAVVAPGGIGLRRPARLLSLAASAGDETVRAQMRLVLQLSRLARAVAELREAQRHAAQAAAARQAAEELRAAWRTSTSWSPQELASARTVAERIRLDFPFPPGTARPGTGPQAGAHRSGPRPSYRPPAPSRRGPGR